MDSSLPPERLLGVIQTQNDVVATATDLAAVMRLVAVRAQGLTGAEGATIELAEGTQLVCHAACGTESEHLGGQLARDSTFSGVAARLGEVLHCRDAEADPRVGSGTRVGCGTTVPAEMRSMICAPLRHGGQNVGVLSVLSRAPHAFDAEDVVTLTLLAGVIAAHMTHADELGQRRPERRHDQLTGLPNGFAFSERLGTEISRVRRHGGHLAVAVLELSGPADGPADRPHDDVVRAVSRHVTRLREEDAVFRTGEASFSLLLVQADEGEAHFVLERVRSAVALDPFCATVVIAAGVAALADIDTAAGLIARAEASLRAAQRALLAMPR